MRKGGKGDGARKLLAPELHFLQPPEPILHQRRQPASWKTFQTPTPRSGAWVRPASSPLSWYGSVIGSPLSPPPNHAVRANAATARLERSVYQW